MARVCEILLPWESQPQEVVGPDPSWAPAGLWNFATEFDAVTGKISTRGSSSVAASAVGTLGRGVAVSGTGTFDRYVLNGSQEAINIGASDFTVGITFRLDGTGGYSALSRWNSGGSAGTNTWLLGADSSFSVAVVAFLVEVGSTVYTASVAGSWSAGEIYSLFGRRIGTTIYVDRYTHSTGAWVSANVTNAGITTVNDISARKFKIGEIDASSALNAALTPFVAATFKYGLTNEQMRRWVSLPWHLFAPQSIGVPVSAGGGSSTSLTVQDATHGHAADSITVTLASSLAIQDATHAHAADNLGLTVATALAIADATHGHTADSPTITVASTIAIQDAAHAHAADSPTLTLGYVDLTIAEATHAHAADSLTLSVSGATDLTIADAAHAHTADSPTLTLGYVDLTIADALHGHTADNITLDGLYTDLELILKILSNRQELNAGTGTFTIYDDDSVSVLFTANAWADAAGTVPYSGGTLGRIDALA